MAIREYIQGKTVKSDRELFGLIGRWLVDKGVHEKLGTAVTAKDGDIWCVSVNSKSEARGFSNARAMGNNALHVRFICCADDAHIVCWSLIKHAIAMAEKGGCESIWTNDRESVADWKKLGFDFTPRARGEFGRWEKQLEGKR